MENVFLESLRKHNPGNQCGPIPKENRVNKQKPEKIPVVELADTLIQPNAMMVELRHTDVAITAMFTSRWFNQLTGRTDLILLKKYSIVLLMHKAIDIQLRKDSWGFFTSSYE